MSKIEMTVEATDEVVITRRPAPPPPPTAAPTVYSTPVNTGKMVLFDWMFNGMALPGGRSGGFAYERLQRHKCVTTDTDQWRMVHFSNGSEVPFKHPRYGVFVSPNPDMSGAVLRGVVDVVMTSNPITFVTIACGSNPDAPYFVRALPVDAANAPLPESAWLETYPVGGFWIDRNGTAKNHPMVIVQNGTYLWTHGNPNSQRCLIPKAAMVPIPAPLIPRPTVPAFNTSLSPWDMARVQVGMNTDAIDQDRHQLCVTNRGIAVTENIQGYRPNEMWDTLPKVPLLDGPRGVCTFPYTTALREGRDGKVYVVSPWSLAVVDNTGYKRTLFGLRHKPGMVPYWEHAPKAVTDPAFDQHFDIVGDIDPSIPKAKSWSVRGWFFLWDPRSLKLDMNAAPIGGEQPHLPYTLPSGEIINGPRGFLGCESGRVLELRFSATDRMAPARIRPWVTGMGNTWGGANSLTDNTFIAAERTTHRVAEWSMDTPNTKVRDVKYSPTAGGGVIGPLKGGEAFQGDHATARLTPIAFPESVRQWPDGSVSVGSMAQEQVRKFKPDGTMSVIANPVINNGSVGSFFVDHSVAPDGMVFTSTFFPDQHGHPMAFRAGGGGWDYTGYGYGKASGRGPDFNGAHYPVANFFGTRLWASDSGGGIDYFCPADSYDLPHSAAIQRGYEKFRNSGKSVLHGAYTTTMYFPWEWGKDLDEDAFVRSCGRRP